ncbi:hypothetical protein LEMLEM_LOCUS11446, partial [Lemmus lemmus]
HAFPTSVGVCRRTPKNPDGDLRKAAHRRRSIEPRRGPLRGCGPELLRTAVTSGPTPGQVWDPVLLPGFAEGSSSGEYAWPDPETRAWNASLHGFSFHEPRPELVSRRMSCGQ